MHGGTWEFDGNMNARGSQSDQTSPRRHQAIQIFLWAKNHEFDYFRFSETLVHLMHKAEYFRYEEIATC